MDSDTTLSRSVLTVSRFMSRRPGLSCSTVPAKCTPPNVGSMRDLGLTWLACAEWLSCSMVSSVSSVPLGKRDSSSISARMLSGFSDSMSSVCWLSLNVIVVS